MADHNTTGTSATPAGAGEQAMGGPNKGQANGGQAGGQEADLHNNQATAVRSSGDQSPADTCRSDRDRMDTPSTTPGTGQA